MSDIDEALAYFRQQRKECVEKAESVGQDAPVFTADLRNAVRHIDTAIQALDIVKDALAAAPAPEDDE